MAAVLFTRSASRAVSEVSSMGRVRRAFEERPSLVRPVRAPISGGRSSKLVSAKLLCKDDDGGNETMIRLNLFSFDSF